MSRVKKYKFIILGLACLVGLFFFSTLKNKRNNQDLTTKINLVVYSYSSFADSWGPGPLIKQKFEDFCHCQLDLRTAEDSRLLINRIELEGKSKGADVLLGVNQWDVDKSFEKLGFSKVVWPEALDIKDHSLGEKGQLLPFDWGPLAINTKKESSISSAKNLKELLLVLPPKSLALQDPRTSAPGLNFFYWLIQVFGEEEAFHYLEQLKSKIYNISSGWSTSYGLFQKGHAKAVFSYVTSPLYHILEEKNLDYRALPFDEGQPVHIEFVGVLPQCIQCEKASEFVRFLLTPQIQKILMEKNYMLPIDQKVVEGTPWDLQKNYKILTRPQWTKEYQTHLLDRWASWLQSQ